MWILLSFLYAITNAIYTTYNDKRHYNGYILGIWRGFGIAFCILPFATTVTWKLSWDYWSILIVQGILIGIYDSHIFFASSKYSGHASSGFMTTCVLITTFLWWGIEINEFKSLLHTPHYFLTLMILLIGYTISFWQMMQVHISKQAEKYLYPAVLALALMSIATRYIALRGGSTTDGIIYYLTISCFISGIFNSLMFIKEQHQQTIEQKDLHARLPNLKEGSWLILFSTILIIAKTIALRLAPNPGYVVAILLTSPLFTGIIQHQKITITTAILLTYSLLIALLILVSHC